MTGARGRMTALTREAVAAIDRARMLDDVLQQHAQLEDALWRAESARVPKTEAAGGLVVAGMGGSAIVTVRSRFATWWRRSRSAPPGPFAWPGTAACSRSVSSC